jgi:hypothetical protein
MQAETCAASLEVPVPVETGACIRCNWCRPHCQDLNCHNTHYRHEYRCRYRWCSRAGNASCGDEPEDHPRERGDDS